MLNFVAPHGLRCDCCCSTLQISVIAPHIYSPICDFDWLCCNDLMERGEWHFFGLSCLHWLIDVVLNPIARVSFNELLSCKSINSCEMTSVNAVAESYQVRDRSPTDAIKRSGWSKFSLMFMIFTFHLFCLFLACWFLSVNLFQAEGRGTKIESPRPRAPPISASHGQVTVFPGLIVEFSIRVYFCSILCIRDCTMMLQLFWIIVLHFGRKVPWFSVEW